MPWKLGLAIIGAGLLLLGYTLLSQRQHRANPDDKTIPTWGQLWGGVQNMCRPQPRTEERWLVVDAAATLRRLFLGLAYGAAGAIIIGVLMGCYPKFDALVHPPIALFAKIPPTAALAIFFVLISDDERIFVAMVAFGILPSMAQSIHLAVRSVPDELLFKAYTLGASQAEIVCSVICRHILPQALDALRLQIGPAMVYLIAAEMISGGVGFGYRIRMQMRLNNMDIVYPYLAILAAFGLAMDYGMRGLQRVMCRWYVPAE